MADPTFGELGTQSFGSLSLTSSGSSGLGLASLSLEDLAQASFSDLATMGYEGGSSSSGSEGSSSPSNSSPLFAPILTTSSALSGLSVVNGQFIVVLDTGSIYVDANNTRVAIGLPNQWGSGNSGKYLQVQSGGTVTSVSLPVYNGETTVFYNGEVVDG